MKKEKNNPNERQGMSNPVVDHDDDNGSTNHEDKIPASHPPTEKYGV